MVKFADPRHRDRFSASADKIKTITRGEITVEPDDTATNKVNGKDAKGCIYGIQCAQLRVSNLRIQKWDNEGQLNGTHCSRDGCERSDRAHLR